MTIVKKHDSIQGGREGGHSIIARQRHLIVFFCASAHGNLNPLQRGAVCFCFDFDLNLNLLGLIY